VRQKQDAQRERLRVVAADGRDDGRRDLVEEGGQRHIRQGEQVVEA
jgi:hypothetical protein